MKNPLKFSPALILFCLLFLSQTADARNDYSSLTSLEGEEYLAFAEQMPEPVDGLASIYKKISYPSLAKQAGVQGKVYVLVFVNEKGGVDDVKVVKGIGAGCDEAACDAIKQVKFKPGVHKGKSVKVKLSLAIQFKL